MAAHTVDWDDLPAAVADADMVLVEEAVTYAKARAYVGRRFDRRTRFVAAVVAVQRYDFTTSMIMTRFNFNSKQAKIIRDFAHLISAVKPEQACAVCERKPRRIGTRCTWCWDTEQRKKKATGPPPSLDSSAVPSINQPC